jgi:hypothetical protein
LSPWEPRRQLKDLHDILGRVFGILPACTTNDDKSVLLIRPAIVDLRSQLDLPLTGLY